MNVIKSLLVASFVLLLLTTTISAATTVSIANVTAEPGDTITLPIMINDITDYGSSTIRIWYDHLVVHVTGVAGSPNSTVVATYTDNNIGYTSIGASNQVGASGDLVFANVEFTVVGFGSSPLDLVVSSLYDNAPLDVPRSISNGSITVEPVKPFFIYGYVCYESGTQCNNPTVSITNLNTYEEWQTETDGSSNYYQITHTSGGDLNVNDVLRFDATDGTDSNVTDHTITTDEVNDGGLFGFNLTLGSIDPAPYLVTYIISNTTISPNGDGIKDDTEIGVKFSEPVDAAIKIENASGVVKSLYASSSKVTDPTPKIWDGTDDGGNIVAGGTYYVNITMDDGVNPLVHDNSRSITMMVGTTALVSIADITADPGDVVTVPLMINNMTDFGTGTINITYDPSVVHVTDVTHSPDSAIAAFNNNNVLGFTAISASNAGGASGDVIFANVEFTAVGSSGDSTPVNLDVVSLYDRLFNDVSTIVSNGSFKIQSSADFAPYLVIYTISNTTISPNGDGVEDDTGIDVKFSESVDAVILIENATGVVKSVYASSSKVTDPTPKIWDGTDNDGDLVADGTYHVNITMDDGVNPPVYDNTRSIVVANISTAIISIGNASATVTIPITIENGTNVGAVDITITYNASVVNVTGVTGGDMDVTIANLEHMHEGFVRIGAFQTSNLGLDGNITFANVTFEPVGSVGGTCSLNLSVMTFKDATPQCNKIPYIVQNGTYTTVLNGDVNGDGKVDIADAMYLAKHVLGKSGFEEIIVGAADVNDDGIIDIADAMYLAKHVIKIADFKDLR